MDIIRFVQHLVMVASLSLIAEVAVEPAQAADAPSKAPAAAGVPGGGLSVAASGAVEDSLKSCLGRIPKDSSSGQRMMAEQGCGRDQETRKSIDVVPGH